MGKKIIKLNESSLNRIIKATAQRIMEEWDSYPEIEGDEDDPENPTAKRYQSDMAWHDLESGALDDPERGLFRKSEQNSEKMHYMKPVGDNPDSWDNVALDEPTNVRDDRGRISMLAQDDANPFWQTVARNKRDTLRKSRGENFESRNRKLYKPEEYLKQTNESKLNKVIKESIKKVLNENGEQSYNPDMKAIIVGGDLEGEYTIKEIIEKFPIKGYEEQSQNPNLKIKLAGYPKIDGYVGPMWDGDRVRYESPESYEFFSR